VYAAVAQHMEPARFIDTGMAKLWKALKMICNDFLVVKVNCPSYVFNISKSI